MHNKGAAGVAGIVPAENFSTMSAHDPVTDAKSQAGALAHLFGGEERVKNSVGLGDSGAVVDERYFYGIDFGIDGAAGAYGDFAVIARFLNGVVGVVQDVQEDLLQLLSVAKRGRQVFVEFFDNLHAMAGKIVTAQLDGLAENCVYLHGFTLRWSLPGETQQILHDFFGSLRLLQNDLQIFARRGGNFGIFEEQVGEPQNRGQRIVDFMRDAGD